MAKHLLLLQALLVATSTVNCVGSNDATVVTSSLSSISLPKISLSTTNHDSHRSNHSSWWNAFDGIPFLMDRRPTRRLGKVKVPKSGLSSDHTLNSPEEDAVADDFHRFLAPAFGNYADHSFQCPATTTCPIVCVAEDAECPEDAQCDENFTLCADGTCVNPAAGEACDDEAESACECETLPKECARQVDLYPNCSTRFQKYYDATAECVEAQEESIPQVNFYGPWFIACYVIISGVTLQMLGWCAWNQRLAPVMGSTVPLISAKLSESIVESAGGARALANNEGWTQTGYKRNIVGMYLYANVILTAILIQYLLLALTVEYYVQQEAITFSLFGNQQFFDELQVLKAFEIVWMVGIVWCFFIKYPTSVHSLFLRRCLFDEASYVAVRAPICSVVTHDETMWITRKLSGVSSCFHSVMSFLYSDASLNAQGSNQVIFCPVRIDLATGSRYFYFRMRRYTYDSKTERFVLGCWDVTEDSTIGHWTDKDFMYKGISKDEATNRLGFVGPNVLDLKKPFILKSIINEFSKPFYLYQNFMVWTWFPYWYYYMAIVQTVVRVTAGLVVSCFQYYSDMDLYRLMVSEGTVEVLRDGVVTIVDHANVVPGDIVRLTPGLAYFDMAILQGAGPLLDESALTGEVHPVAKKPLDPANGHLTYDLKANKSSTISAGTTILECGEGEGTKGDLAIVTQTGSFTAKGKLLSDVMSYERHKFKFDTEVIFVLLILAVEAVVLLAVVFHVIEDNWEYGWFYAMFVVGTVFPPLLPSVFVVSVGISCKRLQRNRINCTNSTGILVAGKVKRAFFDKTGTLTNQGLDFLSAKNETEFQDMERIGVSSDPTLKLGLATCHTLHLSKNGELIGPAVDRMGFSAVSAQVLDEKTISFEGTTVTYLKRFEFDHHSMTQSVVISHGEESTVYVKGSPEAIAKLCVPSSLPSNFHEIARESARNGMYQLAIATSPLNCVKPANEIKREDIERDLNFAGVMDFQNTMKQDTPQVIEELREGGIVSAIITGDNVLTGIYIAKKAGLIGKDTNVVIGNSVRDGVIEWVNATDDSPAELPSGTELKSSSSLALTGEVWQHLLSSNPSAAKILAPHTKIFGRCTPNDKVSIVTSFVEQGETTLFCGDGGNGCGALKAAHVGIALSDAEASFVAPFTSLDKTITSVVSVLKEGRCALASALAAYKYMIMYGQVESINQVANAYLAITFTEWCWVFMDGIWTLTLAFSLPLARAAKKLSPKRPTASILGPHTMASACGVLGINFLFLVFGLVALHAQDWYQCRKWDSTDVSNVLTIGDNYETSVIFIVSGFQYIASAAAFNFGYTFRANWFKNYIFVFFFVGWSAIQFASTLSVSNLSCVFRVNCDNDHVVRSVTSSEPEPINNNWNTTVMPVSFRWILFVLMVANLVLICAWDYWIVNNSFISKLFSKRSSGAEAAQIVAPIGSGSLAEELIGKDEDVVV